VYVSLDEELPLVCGDNPRITKSHERLGFVFVRVNSWIMRAPFAARNLSKSG